MFKCYPKQSTDSSQHEHDKSVFCTRYCHRQSHLISLSTKDLIVLHRRFQKPQLLKNVSREIVGVFWIFKTVNPTFASRLCLICWHWPKYSTTTVKWPWNGGTIKIGWFPTDRYYTTKRYRCVFSSGNFPQAENQIWVNIFGPKLKWQNVAHCRDRLTDVYLGLFRRDRHRDI